MKSDQIIESVRDLLLSRAQVGLTKYKQSMDRDDLEFFDWVNHAQQELLDGAVYLEKLKRYKPLFDRIKPRQEAMATICPDCDRFENLL